MPEGTGSPSVSEALDAQSGGGAVVVVEGTVMIGLCLRSDSRWVQTPKMAGAMSVSFVT